MYVICNSDLFREGLNAVAAFCNSEGFKSIIWCGAAIGVALTAFAYVKQRDIMAYLKWLVMYFLVFNVMLGTPSTVAIINTADQTSPAQIVDNVPFGLAMPAHLITVIGYAFTSDMEQVFSLPNVLSYHNTGMLFGSNLFQLSLASKLDDPDIMNEMNAYVRSCVVGDILINHKYTFNELLHSDDIWGLMTSRPSPIRGMYMQGQFRTCIEASHILTQKINEYSERSAPKILSLFIPTRNHYAPEAINSMLSSTYQYFGALSRTGSNILRQNIAINAFRSGIRNYAAETGSVAGLENISNTMAMNNTRMAWATSGHIGVQTLPLMQVVLLLLLLCMFPLVALLTLIPGLGINVFKNYLYSLVWLETWPIMFAILNMAMNFYVSAGDHGTVTLSSINRLSQEHSDIAGIAGYLVLAIPFLSMGIVKGMAFTFNNAAQYLGGMMHSIAQSTSSSAAMGNYSLGNISTDNATANSLNANKHDTNFMSQHGLSTQQLGNGATVTSTPMGSRVYSTASGMSQLATSEHAAQNAAFSLSNQVNHSITSAFNHHNQYVHSKGDNQSLGNSYTSGVSSHMDRAMSDMNDLTKTLAQKEGISQTEAYRKLHDASVSGSIAANESVGFNIFKTGADIKASESASFSNSRSSSHDNSHVVSTDKNINSSDIHKFSEALNVIKRYSQDHTYSEHNTDSENEAIQMSVDINKADNISANAQYIESHSDAINTNFSQAFANYVQRSYPEEAIAILSATGDSPLLARQQQLANAYISSHAHQLSDKFNEASSNIQHHGFQGGVLYNRERYAVQNYKTQVHDLHERTPGIGLNNENAKDFRATVKNHIEHNDNNISHVSDSVNKEQVARETAANKSIQESKNNIKNNVINRTLEDLKHLGQ